MRPPDPHYQHQLSPPGTVAGEEESCPKAILATGQLRDAHCLD